MLGVFPTGSASILAPFKIDTALIWPSVPAGDDRDGPLNLVKTILGSDVALGAIEMELGCDITWNETLLGTGTGVAF